MTSLSVLDLAIRDIDVPDDRAREYDEATAIALAAVIKVHGLHHPIRVRPNGDRFILISGLHRFRAFQIDGKEVIPATISSAETDDAARLEEVMENLARGELIALDRCHHLFDLKQAWERIHPQAKRGGDRKSIKAQSLRFDPKAPEVFGFALEVAEKVGLSRRSIESAVKIWTELVPTVRAKLAGSDIARKMTELKALSELPAPRQIKVIDLILSPDQPEVKSVSDALAFLEGGVQPTGVEKRLQALRDTLKALPEPVFDRLVADQADRMIAALQRMGRI